MCVSLAYLQTNNMCKNFIGIEHIHLNMLDYKFNVRKKRPISPELQHSYQTTEWVNTV